MPLLAGLGLALLTVENSAFGMGLGLCRSNIFMVGGPLLVKDGIRVFLAATETSACFRVPLLPLLDGEESGEFIIKSEVLTP